MSKRFEIMYEVSAELTVEELWPDGDAPANPTAADVYGLIKSSGGFVRVLRDWNLEDGGYGHVSEVA